METWIESHSYALSSTIYQSIFYIIIIYITYYYKLELVVHLCSTIGKKTMKVIGKKTDGIRLCRIGKRPKKAIGKNRSESAVMSPSPAPICRRPGPACFLRPPGESACCCMGASSHFWLAFDRDPRMCFAEAVQRRCFVCATCSSHESDY